MVCQDLAFLKKEVNHDPVVLREALLKQWCAAMRGVCEYLCEQERRKLLAWDHLGMVSIIDQQEFNIGKNIINQTG